MEEDSDRTPESEITQVCVRSPTGGYERNGATADQIESVRVDVYIPVTTSTVVSSSLYTDSATDSAPAFGVEATTPKKRGGFFIPTTPADKCGSCQKTVYAMEKFEMNTVVYHKNCFRCSHCKSKLTPKTFAVNNGKIYCTNHMMQLFKSKGNYDEGFGHEQHKKKWLSESDRDAEQGQS